MPDTGRGGLVRGGKQGLEAIRDMSRFGRGRLKIASKVRTLLEVRRDLERHLDESAGDESMGLIGWGRVSGWMVGWMRAKAGGDDDDESMTQAPVT